MYPLLLPLLFNLWFLLRLSQIFFMYISDSNYRYYLAFFLFCFVFGGLNAIEGLTMTAVSGCSNDGEPK